MSELLAQLLHLNTSMEALIQMKEKELELKEREIEFMEKKFNINSDN